MAIEEKSLLLDVAQVAALLGTGVSTVRKWAGGFAPVPPGFPPFLRLGRRVVMRRADLEEWVYSLGRPREQEHREAALRRRGRPRLGAV